VRPINLIPAEQRRGPSRGVGGRTSFSGYIVLGALGAAVLCALAVVTTSNKINSKTEELAAIQGDSQREKQVADALRPYGQFADLQRARMTQVKSVAEGRYDWERPLRQLSMAIPRNVWLLGVTGTQSPNVKLDGGAGGDISTMREKTSAPAFTISGCTYSQHAVARVMTRMRNIDDVTAVRLAKSVRKDAADSSTGAAVTADPQQQQQQEEDIQDCTGSERVTKFDLLIEFGGATASGAAGAQSAAVPPGSAAPIADANAAAAQGSAASTAAGGTTP
jgi:Tfp pilus assembly protein PilN